MSIFCYKLFKTMVILLLIMQFLILNGQTSFQEIVENPEKSGGVQYAYPSNKAYSLSPFPDGYKPFYISHFGRHGSRYLVNDQEYKQILDIFKKESETNNLTILGLDILGRLKLIWNEAEGKGGDLTALGIEQQEALSKRMFVRFPDVFNDEAQVTAVSTTVPRCIHSMEIFCQTLSELSPKMKILKDYSPQHMDYLNYHTKEAVVFRSASHTWKKDYEKFEKEKLDPERLLQSLFKDIRFLTFNETDRKFIFELYNIASNLQNMQTKITLYDIFEKQELFDLWQCRNYKLYVQYANAAENKGIMMENSKPLLKNIIEKANYHISNNTNGADIRYGHDGNIIPLAMLLHLQDSYSSVSDADDFYKAWSDFKVSPMSANIQIIFFKKEGNNEILLKFLHNEKEIKIPLIKSYKYPYYLWSDVSNFFLGLIE